jgi:hypothetical protein
MNRLEELGRVDAEKANTRKGARNLKDEKKRIVRELKADGGRAKGLIPEAQEKAKSMTVKSSKRRVKKMGGGSLKAVPADNKGLKKLPTKVRNKMGYMKKGGKVGMGKAMRGGGCVR